MKHSGSKYALSYWLYAIVIVGLLASCNSSNPPTLSELPEVEALPLPTATQQPQTTSTEPIPTMLPFEISSSGFDEGEIIPDHYACTGDNLSPELIWTDPPLGTASFALIFDDPDASRAGWVHWLLFNMSADQRTLPEGIAPLADHPDGSLSGSNSWGAFGYGGPCPPQGSTHHYVFALFALDTVLDLESGATKQELLTVMDSHILAETAISGLFSR